MEANYQQAVNLTILFLLIPVLWAVIVYYFAQNFNKSGSLRKKFGAQGAAVGGFLTLSAFINTEYWQLFSQIEDISAYKFFYKFSLLTIINIIVPFLFYILFFVIAFVFIRNNDSSH